MEKPVLSPAKTSKTLTNQHMYTPDQYLDFLQRTSFVCLCWGFTAQSTQWGHVKHGQFT